MDESDADSPFGPFSVALFLTMLVLAGLLVLPATVPAQAASTGVAGATTGTVDLAAVDELAGKFDLEPAGPGSGDATYAGNRSAALLGDANGDGIGDFAIGDPTADPRGRIDAGSVYVIFGRRGTQPRLSLAELGDRGYRIDGRAAGARLGASLAALGDDNSDGLADFAIGAPRGAPSRAAAAPASSTSSAAAGGTDGPDANIDLVADRDIPRLLGVAPGDRAGLGAGRAG